MHDATYNVITIADEFDAGYNTMLNFIVIIIRHVRGSSVTRCFPQITRSPTLIYPVDLRHNMENGAY